MLRLDGFILTPYDNQPDFQFRRLRYMETLPADSNPSISCPDIEVVFFYFNPRSAALHRPSAADSVSLHRPPSRGSSSNLQQIDHRPWTAADLSTTTTTTKSVLSAVIV